MRLRRSLPLCQLSDNELLSLTLRSAEVFGEFVDRHHSELVTYFVRRTGSVHAANDLAAETLAAALEGVHRFRSNRGNARQWLYGIAKNKLRRYWRDLRVESEARKRLQIIAPAAESESVRAFERVEDDCDGLRICHALCQLSHTQREAVYLKIIKQYDYAELATALRCSEGAARVRVHRGLAELRAALLMPT